MGQARQAGFTLVEILVAVGLVGILVMGLSSALLNSYKHERILQIKQGGREIQDEVRLMISTTSDCAIPLPAGKDTLEIDSSFMDIANADALGPKGTTPYPDNRKLKLVSTMMTLDPADPDHNKYGNYTILETSLVPYRDPTKAEEPHYYSADGGSGTLYRAQINVQYSGKVGANQDKDELKFFNVNVPVIISISDDGSGKKMIDHCTGLGGYENTMEVCKAVGGTPQSDFTCKLNIDAGPSGSGRLSVSDKGDTYQPPLTN
jgi:prepilin-type N-terminal cleavage/methylation domain-containing protein